MPVTAPVTILDLLTEASGLLRTLASEVARLEEAERRLYAVLDVADQAEFDAIRWAEPLRVPEWVDRVRQAALGGRNHGDLASAALRVMKMNPAVWHQIAARRRELDEQIRQGALAEADEGSRT